MLREHYIQDDLSSEATNCQLLAAALLAYSYWWPTSRRHGSGQAFGNCPICGLATDGAASCCQKCAKKLIDKALPVARDVMANK